MGLRTERPSLGDDSEVRRIIDECHATAHGVLRDHRERLEVLAHRLLERETRDESEIYAAVGFDRPLSTNRD